MNYETPFKQKLKTDLKYTDITESSVKNYLRHMELLNDDLPLKNLDFLKDVDNIVDKLKKYKENTKRNYLISISAVLNGYKDKNKSFKKTYMKYFDLLLDINGKLKTKEKLNEKSDTQKENWIKWDEVENKWEELKEQVNKFVNNKELNTFQYNKLLDFVILSLYVLIPPRRNKDYLLMNIIKGHKKIDDVKINYLDLDNKMFIFNNYKTVKTEGQQEIDIDERLMKIINVYLKFRGLTRIKKFNEPFLVNSESKELNNVNSITYVLNRIFKKKVSSSMLRHSYLTHKYGDTLEDMKKDSEAMSHSLDTQKDYIKKN